MYIHTHTQIHTYIHIYTSFTCDACLCINHTSRSRSISSCFNTSTCAFRAKISPARARSRAASNDPFSTPLDSSSPPSVCSGMVRELVGRLSWLVPRVKGCDPTILEPCVVGRLLARDEACEDAAVWMRTPWKEFWSLMTRTFVISMTASSLSGTATPPCFTCIVAVCCSVLQCVAVCCSVLQCVAVCCTCFTCIVARICHTYEYICAYMNTYV